MYLMSKKLSTEAYKGVRDFYPEEMAIQNQIFDIWKNIAQKYGYQEYNASVLEPAELYKAKSGEEIVERQTYTFIDRGEREVTLRPEMTPTVARMVAARKRELVYPLRWFSIPNFFRYEQPQRGRLREFWQLNVDIFGVDSLQAEIECIQMAYDITKAYGLSDENFEIRISSRKLLNYITDTIFKLDFSTSQKLLKLIDKKDKIPEEVFISTAETILGDVPDGEKISKFKEIFFTANLDTLEGMSEIKQVIAELEKLGIKNARFDQTLTRGFDYYTGIVFEVYDKNPENRRSIFGGGRYNDLLDLFGGEKVPAVGFGAGDVIAKDLMETYGKLGGRNASSDIGICVMNAESMNYAQEIAQKLRAKNMKVSIDFSGKKIGDQIKNADKMKIPEVIIIGEEEVKTGKLKIKNLATGEERAYA